MTNDYDNDRNMTMTKKGQVMILSVLALGGTMLGATTIAGLLMVYQLRSTSDVANSAKAIFAADAGMEWMLYQFVKPSSTDAQPIFSNGASFQVTCSDSSSRAVDCRNRSAVTFRSVGRSSNSYRALELSF